MTNPRAHSAYLSPTSGQDLTGRSEMIDRAVSAREGSERLLAALLRFYERRKAA